MIAGVDERVVGREVGAARIAEYDVDALGLEALHDGIDGARIIRADLLDTLATALRAFGSLSAPAAVAADSGTIATSGNSSSVPQRVHSASWSLTILPQPGHWRRNSSRSER